MNSLLSLVFLGCFTLRALAGMEGDPIKSPTGRYVIRNLGDSAQAEDYFEIQTAAGEVLFSPKHDPENSLGLGDPFRHSYAGDVIWSPNDKFVLFTFYDGKYKVTAIYSFADRELISLGHVIDGWTVPIRWVGSRTFVVEHLTPNNGRVSQQTHWRESYRIRKDSFDLDCVYRGKEVTERWDTEEE